MVSPERIESLQQGWVRLMASYGVEPAAAYPGFDLLAASYTDPARYYHTFEHVNEMLRVVGRLSVGMTDFRAVQLAVWFHDAVYDTRAKDNEQRSSDLAVRCSAPCEYRRQPSSTWPA